MKYALDIQLFAEGNEPTGNEPPKGNEPAGNEPPKGNEPEGGNPQDKSYIKIREEKAQEKLLKQLGVKTFEEAQAKLNAADQALTKVNELEQKIQKAEKDKLTEIKAKQLTALLDNEKAFDSDALLHYINLDAVELDANGKIKESEKIVADLKAAKPNFFGKEFIRTDSHVNGNQNTQPNPYEEKVKAGNYVGAMSEYLKNIKK